MEPKYRENKMLLNALHGTKAFEGPLVVQIQSGGRSMGKTLKFADELQRIASITFRDPIPSIKKVIFNPPATIVIWSDDTKTVVKAGNEKFDPEKGLAMAIAKRALGNKGNYFEQIKKWTAKYDEPSEYPSVVYADNKPFVMFDEASAEIELGLERAKNIYLRGVLNQAHEDLFDAYCTKGATVSDLEAVIERVLNDLHEALKK